MHPPRYNYRLTTKGRGHWPVLNAMRHWVNGYAAPDGPPISLVHKNGGEGAHANLVCSECGEPMDAQRSPARDGGSASTLCWARRRDPSGDATVVTVESRSVRTRLTP